MEASFSAQASIVVAERNPSELHALTKPVGGLAEDPTCRRWGGAQVLGASSSPETMISLNPEACRLWGRRFRRRP